MTCFRIVPVLVLALQNIAFAEATVSLVAVSINGIPITPTSSPHVAASDIVAAEIYLSGWATPPFDGGSGLLASYQLTLAGKVSAMSSDACPGFLDRRIFPRGWDAPIEREECACDNPLFPVCNAAYGCVGPNHHPEQMATIEGAGVDRIDSVFHSRPRSCAMNTSSLDIRWGCALNSGGQSALKCSGGANHGGPCTTDANCPGGTCNPQFSHYVGTLYLRVGPNACGTFAYSFQPDITKTYFSNSSQGFSKYLPEIQRLTLLTTQTCPWSGGACCSDDLIAPVCTTVACEEFCIGGNQRFGGVGSTCATIVPPCLCDSFGFLSDPDDCTVDAGIPFQSGSSGQRFGLQAISLQFDQICPNQHDVEDYQVTQVPSATLPLPPSIASIEVVAHTVTIHLSGPVNPNRWTCFRHVPSNRRTCVGYLPGDANSDGVASASDILDIVDNLNGVLNPPLLLHQCDVDRNGVCTPADILTEIDLLNGATGFPVQNGRSLPPCPSTTP